MSPPKKCELLTISPENLLPVSLLCGFLGAGWDFCKKRANILFPILLSTNNSRSVPTWSELGTKSRVKVTYFGGKKYLEEF